MGLFVCLGSSVFQAVSLEFHLQSFTPKCCWVPPVFLQDFGGKEELLLVYQLHEQLQEVRLQALDAPTENSPTLLSLSYCMWDIEIELKHRIP